MTSLKVETLENFFFFVAKMKDYCIDLIMVKNKMSDKLKLQKIVEVFISTFIF